MKLSKNLIKVLAACEDDIDLEEIYNEIGDILGKKKKGKKKKKKKEEIQKENEKNTTIYVPNPNTDSVRSLYDFDGAIFEDLDTARTFMKKCGFMVAGDGIYDGSKRATIKYDIEGNRSGYKIVCNK